MTRLTKTIAAALALGLVVAAGPAVAEEDIIGGDEFLNSCAPCLGAGGRGDGPVAEHLNVKPSDLTKMAEQNDGRFPFIEAFHIVDGRTMVGGHGARAMPIWGQGYRIEAGGDEQPINRMATETIVRARVHELVNYLAAIQQPAGQDGSIPSNQ